MNKVYLKIEESPFKFKYGGFIFYFSSNFNRVRFIEGVDRFIDNETLKIIAKYKVKINMFLYLSLAYYKKIEKRGYHVTDIDGKIYYENSLLKTNFLCE